MPVETASDIASFFGDDEFAEAALYQSPNPGAPPVPCLVIMDRGQGRERLESGAGMDGRRAVTSERHLWAIAGDDVNQLADVKRGGLFTITARGGTAGGEVLRVAGLPKLDHAGNLWSVQLTIEAGAL